MNPIRVKITAYMYNLISDLVGGFEVTLTENR